jgi:hypothetical protein
MESGRQGGRRVVREKRRETGTAGRVFIFSFLVQKKGNVIHFLTR